MTASPRSAAQFVFEVLDTAERGKTPVDAMYVVAESWTGAGGEELRRLAPPTGPGPTADEVAGEFEKLAGRWGATCFESLGFLLRAARHGRAGPAMISEVRRQAEADAFAPPIETVTAARFVVGVVNVVTGLSMGVEAALMHTAQRLRGPGAGELLAACETASSDVLERLADEWPSASLAELASILRQGAWSRYAAEHLRALATSEAVAGQRTMRAFRARQLDADGGFE